MEVVNNEVTERGTYLRSRWPVGPMCLMSPFCPAGYAGELCPSETPQHSTCLLVGRQGFGVSSCMGRGLQKQLLHEGRMETVLTAHGAAWALSKTCESGVLNGTPQMLETF